VTSLLGHFFFQSYFDSALHEHAILSQSVGNPIVASTRQYAQGMEGEGVALHPASQSPIALKFRGGEADNAVITLTPGQKVRVGTFSEFEWGLPFGWLGGGNVQLFVLHGEKSDVEFSASRSPIIFHRFRCAIVATSQTVAAVKNWPGGFPWPNALQGAGNTPQQAATHFNVIKEAVLLRLRVDLTAAIPIVPATFDLVWRGTTALDLDATDTLGVTDRTTYAVTFMPQNHAPTGGEFVVTWLPVEIARLGGDSANLSIVDNTGLYTTSHVDIVRYGRLM